MLVVGLLFGALVAGPLLVLGALALANSDRAMARLNAARRRWLPSRCAAPTEGIQPNAGQHEATDAHAPADSAFVP